MELPMKMMSWSRYHSRVWPVVRLSRRRRAAKPPKKAPERPPIKWSGYAAFIIRLFRT
jgi:hypothetical protein